MASSEFAETTVDIPHGRIGWVRWHPRPSSTGVGFNGRDEGRLTLQLDAPHGDVEAQWTTDVLCGLLDLGHGPSGITLEAVEVELPASRVLLADDLLRGLDILDERADAISGMWWPTDGPIHSALECIGPVLASSPGHYDRGLPGGLLYYRVSTQEFAFLGDSIGWARSDEGRVPPASFFVRAKVEQSFHNAFKTIEAVLGGEPPSDDARFRRRLSALGVDPDEPVGFGPDKEPLIDVLRRVRETRDARAAHAGRTSAATRGITYYELMEAQAAAAAVLTCAILHLVPTAARDAQGGTSA
jgi:hypothetical protein